MIFTPHANSYRRLHPRSHASTDWPSAIKAFEAGAYVGRIFTPLYQRLIVQAKRQELDTFLNHVTEFEYNTYLEVV